MGNQEIGNRVTGNRVMGNLKTEICQVNMLRLSRILSPFLILMALASVASAHPFHICVGQMRWNEEEKYWEVSLRLHPQDLEQSMQRWRLSQSRDELDKGRPVEALLAGCRVEDPHFETHAIEFLNQNFFLYHQDADKKLVHSQGSEGSSSDESNPKSRLVWVGKEYEKAWVWLHMELHPPTQRSSDSQLYLCHKVLLGEIPEQENSVLVEQSGRQRFSLQFKGEDIARPLAPQIRSSDAAATNEGSEVSKDIKK
jgi:hypothetical protein